MWTLPIIETRGAMALLNDLGLRNGQRIVAWDVIERDERTPKRKIGSDPLINYRRAGEGDRHIFSALDSAISASLGWIKFDRNRGGAGHHATLQVPLCVLSIPFWGVSIDKGEVATPAVKTLGYQSNAYPLHSQLKEIMALVCAIEDIARVADALERLADNFFYAVRQSWSGWREGSPARNPP